MSRLLRAPLALALALAGGLAAQVEGPRDQEPRSVAQLLAAGRELLDRYRPAQALPLFERAAELDGSTIETRLWVLRAWMDQGRSNDTLDAIDALARGGESGPEIAYLYGMAFARRAEGHLAAGVTDSSIQMNFLDAKERLQRAVAAAPERFSDAFLALAESAWFTQDLATARSAGEQAVAYHRDDGRAWLQLGKIALSQFKVAHDAEPWSPAAEAHWRAAHDAFLEAVTVLGRPVDDPGDQARLAEAALQLGHARVWKRNLSRAADAYAVAVAWAPEEQDYATLRELLLPTTAAATEEGAPGAVFHRMLEEGARRFEETFGNADPRDATLRWWLGWARLEAGLPAEAETAFLDCVAEAPDYVNTWFWIALARLAREDRDGAAEALVTGWELDATVLVREMQSDLERNVWKVETLIGPLRERGDFARCAVLAELCAEAQLDEPRHWNNLGLFLRFDADRLESLHGTDGAEPDPAELLDLRERSLAAYERALRLDPQNPQLLNDTAVVLHHALGRDLERALAMYVEARTGAERILADSPLDEEQRAFWEGVASDAAANHAELLAELSAALDDGEPPR